MPSIFGRRKESRLDKKYREAKDELEDAIILREVARIVAADLEKDRKANHYADMVRRALWTYR